MEIILSEIAIVPVKPRNGLLAFCSFVLNNQFYVADVAIYSRLNREGYRLVYPIRLLSTGANVHCFHPIKKEAAQIIETAVITEYEKLMKKVEESRTIGENVNERFKFLAE